MCECVRVCVYREETELEERNCIKKKCMCVCLVLMMAVTMSRLHHEARVVQHGTCPHGRYQVEPQARWCEIEAKYRFPLHTLCPSFSKFYIYIYISIVRK